MKGAEPTSAAPARVAQRAAPPCEAIGETVGPVSIVAEEHLVAAVSRQSDGHVTPDLLRQMVHGHRRGIGEGLVEGHARSTR